MSELQQLHPHEQQDRRHGVKGKDASWNTSVPAGESNTLCKRLFSFQIKTWEDRRLSLPAVSIVPPSSTGNEVDTPQPTPAGPPSHQPAGACTETVRAYATSTPKSSNSSLLQAEAPQGPRVHRGFPVLLDLRVRLEEKESPDQSVKNAENF